MAQKCTFENFREIFLQCWSTLLMGGALHTRVAHTVMVGQQVHKVNKKVGIVMGERQV